MANPPVEIIHNKYEHYSFLPGALAHNVENSVNAVYYKPAFRCLRKNVLHDAVEVEKENNLKKNQSEDVQLLSKIKLHHLAFLVMVKS